MPLARRAIVILLFFGLAACAGGRGTHIEPQVPPDVGIAITHSPADPQVVLITEYAGALSVWRVADLNAPERLATVFTDAHRAAFSADGKTLVVAGKDGKLRILNFDGQSIAESRDTMPANLPTGLAVDPNGQRIVTTGRDGVWAWSLPDLARSPIEENLHASAVTFSASGALAVGYATGAIKIWTNPAAAIPLRGHGEEILSLAFLPSGDKLLAASSTSVRLWDVRTPQEAIVLTKTPGGDQTMKQVMVDSSSGYFAAVYDDDEDDEEEGALWLWNAQGVHLATQDTDPIRAAGLLPGGHPIAITAEGFVAFRLSLGTQGTMLPRECSAAYAPERDQLAVACEAGVWLVPGHQLTEKDLEAVRARPPTLLPPAKRPVFARFLTGAERLAVVHDDESVSVWQLDQPATPPASFTVTVEDAVDLALSRSRLAIAAETGTVQIWNITGEPHGSPIATGQPLTRIAMSENDDLLATGGKDGSLALWTPAGESRWRLASTGLTEIAGVDFSPDGRTIVAADTRGAAVEVTIDGKPGAPFSGIGGAARHLAFSSNGQRAFLRTDGVIALRAADGTMTTHAATDRDAISMSLNFTRQDTELVAILWHDRAERTTIALWRPGLQAATVRLPNQFNLPLPVLSATGDTVVSGGSSWNLVTGQVRSADVGTALPFYSPRVSFVARSSDGMVQVRSADGNTTREVSVPSDASPALSDTGRLAYVDRDQTLYVEHPEGRFEAKPAAGKVGTVVAAADGRWFAARYDGTVSVWNGDGTPAQHPLNAAPPLATKYARVVAVDPEGARVAMNDSATGIWIRDQNDTSGPVRLPGQSKDHRVRDLTFRHDGEAIAAVSDRSELFTWNVSAPTEMKKWRAGVAPWMVRATDDGWWTASLSGELYLLNDDLDTLARIVTSREGAVAVTRDFKYAGYGPLYQRTRLYTSALTPLGESEAVKHFSLDRVRLTMTRQLGWWTLTRDAVVATTVVVVAAYSELPGWAKAGLWPTALYAALLLAMIGMWVIAPARVAALAMPSYTAVELPAWKVVTDTLSLAQWLGNTGRALDGWLLATRQQQLAQGFEGKIAIQKRSVYVDLGNEADVEAWTTAVRTNTAAHFWVTGPGGCGKSTLAFHLVRAALDACGQRPVIPVVVDSDWTGPLLEHIAEALRQGSRGPTPAMVRRLAYTGRLVLVFDGLSERRSDEARDEVLALTDSRVLRYMIATARSEKPQRDGIRHVTVGPLDGARLETFVAAYVDDSRREAALACLRDLSHGQPIRPLFATIALEWFVRGESIPGNYPALIHAYVQRLCPQGDKALRDDDFLRAARLVAMATVKEGWTPRPVSREFVRGQLDAEALPFLSAAEQPAELSPAVVIDQLVQCGLVEQLATLGAHDIRFCFDPVAEYLAAMHIVMQERGAVPTRLPDPLPDTPFTEALRSIRATAVVGAVD